MRCVATDGPRHATILFLGEAPGRDEDRGGRPFIGRAGGEFNHNYLKLAGLERDQIRITNSVRCRPDNNKKPADSLRLACASHHLAPELEEYGDDLQLIVPMGGVACGLFEPKIDLAVHHGFPITRRLFGRDYTVFPVYHPAAGLHSSGMLAPLVRDFERLGEWLAGTLQVPRNEFKGREQYAAVRGDEVRQIVARGVIVPPAIDTEHVKRQGKKVLWSAQFSVEPGTGWLIWADDRVGMGHLVDAANTYGYTMHYSTEDWEELRRNGWVLDDSPGMLYDTIQGAFGQAIHSGGAGGSEETSGGMWGGLGLKNLAWRMCGIEMRSYQDLVWGASKRAVVEWLLAAKAVVPERAEVLKTKVRYKAGRFVSVLNRIERYTRDSEDYDPWEKWGEAVAKADAMEPGQERDEYEEALVMIAECCGPMPEEGIDKADRQAAIRYACEDANATGMLRLALEREGERLGKVRQVDRKDWVA